MNDTARTQMNQATTGDAIDTGHQKPRSKPHATSNRDIKPYARLALAFPALKPVIDNREVADAFAVHETAAVRWKALYTLLGRTALVCIFLVMAFFAYSFIPGRLYATAESLRAFFAVIAALGLGSQLVLIFGRIKERWLVERFAAERLRCLKFQAFAVVAVCEDASELAPKVAAFTNENLARLEQEILGGRSALHEFSPSEQSIKLKSQGFGAPPELVRDAFSVYDTLRLEVQLQHFGEQARLSEERARMPSFLSELAFGLGAVLAFIDICAATWKGLGHGGMSAAGPFELWLAFFTLLLFIASAVLAIYQRGAANIADAERYKHYAREIRRVREHGVPESAEAFFRTVEQTEQIELRELFDFCRDVAHSSYIF